MKNTFLKNDRWLWFIFSILAFTVFISSLYLFIKIIFILKDAGVAIESSLYHFLFYDSWFYLFLLLIGITAIFRWRIALLLNLITAYIILPYFYNVYFSSKTIFAEIWGGVRNFSAIAGVLMFVVGLILIVLSFRRGKKIN